MTATTDEQPALLEELADDLLDRDAETHAKALDTIADAGDQRTILPLLIEVLMIHETGSN